MLEFIIVLVLTTEPPEGIGAMVSSSELSEFIVVLPEGSEELWCVIDIDMELPDCIIESLESSEELWSVIDAGAEVLIAVESIGGIVVLMEPDSEPVGVGCITELMEADSDPVECIAELNGVSEVAEVIVEDPVPSEWVVEMSVCVEELLLMWYMELSWCPDEAIMLVDVGLQPATTVEVTVVMVVPYHPIWDKMLLAGIAGLPAVLLKIVDVAITGE
jgi:hypothetical protein